MASLKIYLDKRGVPEGKDAPVKITVSHNRQTAHLSTGIKVAPAFWENGKVSKKHPNAKWLNSCIQAAMVSAERELLKLSELGGLKGATARQVKDKIDLAMHPEKDRRDSNMFLTRYERFMGLKSKFKTVKGYKWTLSALHEFDTKLSSRTFEDITADYLKDFIKHVGEKNNRNSQNIHLRYIRAVFNDAIDAGITTAYPFRSIKIKPMPVKKKSLSVGELRTLFAYPCEPWQEEYRDMFKLMFLLRGVNAVDLFSASLSQVVKGRLEYRRSKVGTLFSVKIEPEAKEIMEKYRGRDYLLSPLDRCKNHEDYLHRMNDGLKAIGRPLGKRGKVMGDGLFPELSSNWARHSWATVGIGLDIPKDTISRGLGHSFGVPVTDIYIKYDMKKVDEANRRIMDYVLYGRDYRNESNR